MRQLRRFLVLLLCLTLLSGCASARQPEPTPEPTPCPHGAWEDGVCTLCGESCAHPAWQDGVCTVCGLRCEHPAWQDGVCTICGWSCPHEAHGQDGRCLLCGTVLRHVYVAGRCACGAEPQVYDEVLPDRYYEPCPHEGSIQALSYSVEWGGYTRHLLLYLPYGYDPHEQYNVLILLHGTGDDETAWLTAEHYVPNRIMQVHTIFDWMIEEELIPPLIIVSLRLYEDYGAYPGDPGEERLGRELREIVLPYLAEHYGTYAAGSDFEQLSAARQHVVLGGLSWGAYFTFASGMRHNLPLIGGFICLSGSDSADLVYQSINAPGQASFPIYLYYAAAGEQDFARDGSFATFRYLVDNTPRLVEGQNAFLHECHGAHTWNVWSTEMFNALQLAFVDQAPTS